jgi:hypothetical protein
MLGIPRQDGVDVTAVDADSGPVVAEASGEAR